MVVGRVAAEEAERRLAVELVPTVGLGGGGEGERRRQRALDRLDVERAVARRGAHVDPQLLAVALRREESQREQVVDFVDAHPAGPVVHPVLLRCDPVDHIVGEIAPRLVARRRREARVRLGQRLLRPPRELLVRRDGALPDRRRRHEVEDLLRKTVGELQLVVEEGDPRLHRRHVRAELDGRRADARRAVRAGELQPRLAERLPHLVVRRLLPPACARAHGGAERRLAQVALAGVLREVLEDLHEHVARERVDRGGRGSHLLVCHRAARRERSARRAAKELRGPLRSRRRDISRARSRYPTQPCKGSAGRSAQTEQCLRSQRQRYAKTP